MVVEGKKREKTENQLCIDATKENFKTAQEFVGEILKREKITETRILETSLIFEELFLKITDSEQYKIDDGKITISLKKQLGEVRVCVSFFGERFDLDFDMSRSSNDPGTVILSRYEDKIDQRYRRRNNSISILSRRNYSNSFYLNLAAMLGAIVTYLIMVQLLSPDQLMNIRQHYLIIPERIFANAMTMIAAPVTFFSLVTNITNVSILGDRQTSLKPLILKTVRMSFTAILAGLLIFGIAYPLTRTIGDRTIGLKVQGTWGISTSSETITNLIPSSLVEAFSSLSPVPLVFLAVVTAIAMISMNKHFNTIKAVNDAFGALFSRMLGIIMIFLPVVVYSSLLKTLLANGIKVLVIILFILLCTAAGVGVLFFWKCLVIASKGGNAIEFIKTCRPAIVRNYQVNSSIDAVQYNIRFCNRFLGVRNSLLEVDIPVLSQISLGGNCFILTLFALIGMCVAGVQITPYMFIIMAILIFVISVSAPNQPGSFLLGMIIILRYLQIPILNLSAIFYLEALVGRFLSLINSFGDVVTVYCMELDERKKEAAQSE